MHPRDFTFFFFNDTATTEIYTLSLHDALPILVDCPVNMPRRYAACGNVFAQRVPQGLLSQTSRYSTQHERKHQHEDRREDRKSTRLNSSHGYISYAVFCLKKKNESDDSIMSKR